MPKYPCAYCGRRLKAEQMIHSRHTGKRYCAIDQARCEARGAKAKRARLRREKAERRARRQEAVASG